MPEKRLQRARQSLDGTGYMYQTTCPTKAPESAGFTLKDWQSVPLCDTPEKMQKALVEWAAMRRRGTYVGS